MKYSSLQFYLWPMCGMFISHMRAVCLYLFIYFFQEVFFFPGRDAVRFSACPLIILWWFPEGFLTAERLLLMVLDFLNVFKVFSLFFKIFFQIVLFLSKSCHIISLSNASLTHFSFFFFLTCIVLYSLSITANKKSLSLSLRVYPHDTMIPNDSKKKKNSSNRATGSDCDQDERLWYKNSLSRSECLFSFVHISHRLWGKEPQRLILTQAPPLTGTDSQSRGADNL